MVSDVFDNTLTDFLFLKEEDRMNYILDMLNTLTKREENVLRMYFGIDRERRLTIEEIGQDYDRTRDTIKRVKNKGIRKVINRVTNHELFESGAKNHWTPLSSHIDKDLIKRCVKERGKLLDEFMMKLLYPPKEIVEKWVLK
jgi:predicted DNA-binding protein YlxM (UPF0122 family)